ncbi:MAG: DUF503 domain-containing protein [Proteobacteria bacterium]|nr:DUF503 domain-containing protein [Pseudomonadota bacterium]
MFVGILKIEIFIPYARSLKEKRQVLKKVIDSLRNKYPVSVAEVDKMDLWQKGVIGVSLVSGDRRFLESLLDKIVLFVETNFDCNVVDTDKEIISW